MEIYLIRHGKTAGNGEGRGAIGTTDEPLCSAGIEELKYPLAGRTAGGGDCLYQ